MADVGDEGNTAVATAAAGTAYSYDHTSHEGAACVSHSPLRGARCAEDGLVRIRLCIAIAIRIPRALTGAASLSLSPGVRSLGPVHIT